MMAPSEVLDSERVRQLFDLRANYNVLFGGAYEDDPYPVWADLRQQAPVHRGIVHEFHRFRRARLLSRAPFRRPAALLGVQLCRMRRRLSR